MSYKAIGWAYELPLKGPAKPVLVALADFADEEGSCYPGQDRLCRMTGLSPRTIRRALTRLEDLELIRREHRYDRRGYRTSDRYFLAVDVQVLPVTVTTGQSDHRSDSPRLPATVTGTHRKNHQENLQGGETPTPTPFCSNHPGGTEKPCTACRLARTAFEELEKAAAATESVRASRYDLTVYCPHLRLRTEDCDGCEQEARKALEAQFGANA